MCIWSLLTIWAAPATAVSADYQIIRGPHHDRLLTKSVLPVSFFLVPIDILCDGAGAGKTHTMEGSKQDPGINYRAMKELFRSACTPVNNPFTWGIHWQAASCCKRSYKRMAGKTTQRGRTQMSPATL